MNPMVSKFAEEIDNSDTEYDTAVADTANNDEDENDFVTPAKKPLSLSNSSGNKEKSKQQGFEGLFIGAAAGTSMPVKSEEVSEDLEDFLSELASKDGPTFDSHDGYDSL
jgi:hypothetical protein